MATKKESKKVPYIYGHKASDVDMILFTKIESLYQTLADVEKEVKELKNREPKNVNFTIVVPEEKKPWYKRLFGK